MKEVEILVEVKSSLKDALSSLEKYKYSGVKETTDRYFFDPLRLNLQPDTEGRLLECFRIRLRGGHAFMTYKVDIFKNKVWQHSEENEIQVSDSSVASAIIKSLGLKELVVIKNRKHIFVTNKYEIALEEVDDLGLFLEVEALDTKVHVNIEKIKKGIRGFVADLDLQVGQELNLGKPELLLRKLKSRF